MSSVSSKLIEYERYNKRSEENLKKLNSENIHLRLGVKSLPKFLQPPYIKYEELIRQNSTPGKVLLDVCCGDGMHSLAGVGRGVEIYVSDISEKSVKLIVNKAKLLGYELHGIVADAEKLPFSDNSFDIITCAGSLSYVDLNAFMNEVDRILSPGGVFICVDSFNHNPIYSFNRFIHFLRGNRTYSTLKRMPNLKTIHFLENKYNNIEINYFGIFIFLVPFFKLFISTYNITLMLNKLDQYFHKLNRYAFKVVIKVVK
mgnify:CR=1 FL=1